MSMAPERTSEAGARLQRVAGALLPAPRPQRSRDTVREAAGIHLSRIQPAGMALVPCLPTNEVWHANTPWLPQVDIQGGLLLLQQGNVQCRCCSATGARPAGTHLLAERALQQRRQRWARQPPGVAPGAHRGLVPRHQQLHPRLQTRAKTQLKSCCTWRAGSLTCPVAECRS